MKNGLVLLAVTLSVVSFGGMMRIKTDVQQMVRQRQQLADQRLQLRETKRVLEAEYAMLINPLRLTQLAQSRGYEELSMNRLMPLATGGPSSTVPSPTQPGMTLAAVLRAAQTTSAALPAATSAIGNAGTPLSPTLPANRTSPTSSPSPTKIVLASPVNDSAPTRRPPARVRPVSPTVAASSLTMTPPTEAPTGDTQ